MYRSKKIDDQGQVIYGGDYYAESKNHLVHNLPMLNPRLQRPNFSEYSWSSHGTNLDSRPWRNNMYAKTEDHGLNDGRQGELYIETVRNNGAYYMRKKPSMKGETYKIKHHDQFEYDEARVLEHGKIKQGLTKTRSSPMDPQIMNCQRGEKKEEPNSFNDTKKRKLIFDEGIDLNLTLSMKGSRTRDDDEVDDTFCLSLFPSSSVKEKYCRDYGMGSKFKWLEEGKFAKNRRMASTLDLTI